jgi:hypothetical protein
VDLLVILFEEEVEVVKLRSLNEPVVLLVLVVQGPERALDLVELRDQLLDNLLVQPDWVVLDHLLRAPGLAVCSVGRLRLGRRHMGQDIGLFSGCGVGVSCRGRHSITNAP